MKKQFCIFSQLCSEFYSLYNHLNLIFFCTLQVKAKTLVELIGFSDITEGTKQSILCVLENFYLNHSFTLLNGAVQVEKEEKAGVFFCVFFFFSFFFLESMNWLLISDAEMSEYLNRRKGCLDASLIKLFFA